MGQGNEEMGKWRKWVSSHFLHFPISSFPHFLPYAKGRLLLSALAEVVIV
jgi:hypothetical protein